MQGIYMRNCLYLIFSRIQQSHGGVSKQDVGHFVLVVAGHVFGYCASLAHGHMVGIRILVTE